MSPTVVVRFRSLRVILGTVVLATVVSSLWCSAVHAQSDRTRPREVPWRQDQGAGRLTNPGRSRVLPRVEEDPAARVASNDRATDEAPPAGGADATTTSSASQGQWWKEDAERTIGNPEQGGQGRGVSPRGEIILSTQILAWVGNEPILAGDLLGRINEALQKAVGKVPEAELDKQRWVYMEQLLPAAIESKMVYLDFKRKLEQAQIDAMRVSIYKQFDEKQLPRLIEQAKATTGAELEARLRSYGTSLENVRRGFFEQVAAREMIRRNGEDDREVTHDDLLAYYQEHAAEYELPAKARWEHLMARFSRFPTKRAAYIAVGEMGNMVLRGAKLETVAREHSHGPSAAEGGQYEWTTQGSLVSMVLDEAIFSLPIGELSERLEDEEGFHIVRVLERQDAGRTPFLDAQAAIRDKIKEGRNDEVAKTYLERVKRETYVWNYFEAKDPASASN